MSLQHLDRIDIRRLSFFARHGVLAAEEALGQRFIISITAFLDLTAAAAADSCGESVCYNKLAMAALDVATLQRFRTLEALGAAILQKAFTQFAAIAELAICIEKPGAPVAAVFETVTVTMRRTRSEMNL